MGTGTANLSQYTMKPIMIGQMMRLIAIIFQLYTALHTHYMSKDKTNTKQN